MVKKILKAKTDSINGISFDPTTRPDISNLVQIYACASGLGVEQVVDAFAARSTGDFKKALAELLADVVGEISAKINALLKNDTSFLLHIMQAGAEKATATAQAKIKQVKLVVGLL